jgi:hypothetical protein
MMAQAQNDHLFDGPLNNPTRQQNGLEQDLRRGRVHAFVADAVMQRGSGSLLRQTVAYALYNYGASSHRGKEGEVGGLLYLIFKFLIIFIITRS